MMLVTKDREVINLPNETLWALRVSKSRGIVLIINGSELLVYTNENDDYSQAILDIVCGDLRGSSHFADIHYIVSSMERAMKENAERGY